jgi:hypothetical protein
MIQHLETYMSLGATQRQLVKTAVRAGDTKLTRSLLLLYFPKLSAADIPSVMDAVRNLPG